MSAGRHYLKLRVGESGSWSLRRASPGSDPRFAALSKYLLLFDSHAAIRCSAVRWRA